MWGDLRGQGWTGFREVWGHTVSSVVSKGRFEMGQEMDQMGSGRVGGIGEVFISTFLSLIPNFVTERFSRVLSTSLSEERPVVV